MLPHELTRAVLLELRASAPLKDLASAILTCKEWSLIGLPILYEHVALAESNLRTFTQQLTAQNRQLVRSLSLKLPLLSTLALPQPDWPAKVLADSPSLQSLSLILLRGANQGGGDAAVKLIDESTIQSLLQHLPKSCLSLELDTGSLLRRKFSGPDYHLCPLIAGILPQLRHLRLQIPSICAQIYGSAYDRQGDSIEQLESSQILASNLKSACFQCRNMHLCRKSGDTFTGQNRIDGSGSAHALLKASLSQIKAECLPSLDELCIMTHVPQSLKNEDALIYPPVLKLDCVKQQITAMPSRQITATGDPIHILSLPAYPDAVVSSSSMDALAEGYLWQDIERPQGCRLAAAIVPSLEHLVAKPLAFWRSRDDFWVDHPKKTCVLWHNECQSGSRLLDPQVRQGLTDFSPVKQRIPKGWKAEIIHGPEDEGGTMLHDQLRSDDGKSCRVLAGNDVRCDHGFTLDYKE